ncbi:hypothetical protein ACFLVX_02115 [Chloroflexota bacterium]
MSQIKTNPYVYTKEVINEELFAGRERELESIAGELSNLEGGQTMRAIALTGVPRIGKTSILLRIVEMCDKKGIFPVIVNVEDKLAENPWEFWYEVYKRIIIEAQKKGVIDSNPAESITFWKNNKNGRKECHLSFEEEYSKYKNGSIVIKNPDELLVSSDMALIMEDIVLGNKFLGMVLMFDEAQKLQEFTESKYIKENLRNIFISNMEKVGLIFSGLEKLGGIFVGPNETFRGRGHTIPVGNFTLASDIRKCAIQPLEEQERKLMSPMTLDYISLLSRGMPNYIRLICYAIYDRYRKGKQKDLNITIDIMEDLLEVIERDAQVEGKLQDIVGKIRELKSTELEILYSITRFPKWSLDELVDLDESFRGEKYSEKAAVRRKDILKKQKILFVSRGLIEDDPVKLILSGGEFVSEYAGLYLRFWYEVEKYGELSRNIIIGRGPQTPFGEKTDKIASSISWQVINVEGLSSEPPIVVSIFHTESKEKGQLVVERVLNRYKIFEKIRNGELKIDEHSIDVLLECTEVCQFIKKPGRYLLVCVSIRNRDKYNELVQLELYYKINDDIEQTPIIDLSGFVEQAQSAEVVIEGQANTIINNLPDLDGLYGDFGTCRGDFFDLLSLDNRWLIESVQYLISEKVEGKQEEEKKEEEDTIEGKWITEYAKDHTESAEDILTTNITLHMGSDAKKLARLHNDRGYIYSLHKNKYPAARHDLELALDYHYAHLPVTILNISYLNIMEQQYRTAIEGIEAALLLLHGREELEAGYLRTIVPESTLAFMKQIWEHRPANLLEISYILLAYAIYKESGDSFERAEEIINEGLSLLPSSIWLKHALARYYIKNFQAPKAMSIYIGLSELKMKDESLEWEINKYMKIAKRKRTDGVDIPKVERGRIDTSTLPYRKVNKHKETKH